eukprot:6230656-Pyramimonas_sp.AAC.1
MPRARLSGKFRLRHPRSSGLIGYLTRDFLGRAPRDFLTTLASEMPCESWTGQFRLRHPRSNARWPRP